MKIFFQTIFSKTTSIILLIAAIVVLCPAQPVKATELSVCDANTTMASDSSHGAKGTDCSTTHSELGSHTLNILSTFNNLFIVFLVGAVGFVLFHKKLLYLFFGKHLTRLRYHQQKYKNYIKPKLEKMFLGWLTLLGGEIAYSV